MDFDTLKLQFQSSPLEVRRYIPDKFAKYAMLVSIPILIDAMLDVEEEEIIRIECAEALGKLGDTRAIHPLSTAYCDTYIELRRTAIWSLGQIGTHETLGTIGEGCFDDAEIVKRWALKSLGRVRCKKVELIFERLLPILHDENTPSIIIIELIRSVTTQMESIQNLDPWFHFAVNQLSITSDKNQLLASINLLNSEKGLAYIKNNNHVDLIIKKFDCIDDSLPYIEPLVFIISKLDYGNILERRVNIETNPKILTKIIPSLQNWDALEKFMGSSKTDTYTILKAVLRNPKLIDIELLCKQFKERSPKETVLLLQIYAAQNKPFEKIDTYLRSNNPSFGILRCLLYYDLKSLPILEKYITKGNKSQRKDCIFVLKELMIKFPDHEPVKNMLEKVMNGDRIWHFRRDARISLESRCML